MIPTNILNIITRINPNIRNLQNINSPDDMAQHLLNTGVVNQNQVNAVKQIWGSQADVRQSIHNKYQY